MNTLIAIYQSVPHSLLLLLWASCGGAVLAGTVELIKRFSGVHLAVVIHTVTITLAFLANWLPTVIASKPEALQVLGEHAAVAFVAANIVYAVVKAVIPFWGEVQKEAAKQTGAAVVVTPAVQSVTTQLEYEG